MTFPSMAFEGTPALVKRRVLQLQVLLLFKVHGPRGLGLAHLNCDKIVPHTASRSSVLASTATSPAIIFFTRIRCMSPMCLPGRSLVLVRCNARYLARGRPRVWVCTKLVCRVYACTSCCTPCHACALRATYTPIVWPPPASRYDTTCSKGMHVGDRIQSPTGTLTVVGFETAAGQTEVDCPVVNFTDFSNFTTQDLEIATAAKGGKGTKSGRFGPKKSRGGLFHNHTAAKGGDASSHSTDVRRKKGAYQAYHQGDVSGTQGSSGGMALGITSVILFIAVGAATKYWRIRQSGFDAIEEEPAEPANESTPLLK